MLSVLLSLPTWKEFLGTALIFTVLIPKGLPLTSVAVSKSMIDSGMQHAYVRNDEIVKSFSYRD